MILIEIKLEACYLKKNGQKPQEKTAKIQTHQIDMAFGQITSSFSVEQDFRIYIFLCYNAFLQIQSKYSWKKGLFL